MIAKKEAAIAALAMLALAGCKKSEADTEIDIRDRMQFEAEKGIKERLKDPASATFSDVRVSNKGEAQVVCGYVNSKNSFGGMTGKQRFLSNGLTIFVIEEDMAAGGMDETWHRFC